MEVPRATQEQRFQELTQRMFELYKSKNTDYGDSARKTFDRYGLTAYLARMTDKLNRLDALNRNQQNLVKDEKITDTLIDLANYCILAIIDLTAEEVNA